MKVLEDLAQSRSQLTDPRRRAVLGVHGQDLHQKFREVDAGLQTFHVWHERCSGDALQRDQELVPVTILGTRRCTSRIVCLLTGLKIQDCVCSPQGQQPDVIPDGQQSPTGMGELALRPDI